MLFAAFLLSFSGILSRIIGFFYKLFLSRAIGAEQLGIYQLIFPLFTVLCAFSSSGFQTAISKHTASEDAEQKGMFFYSGLFLSISCSLMVSLILFFFSKQIAVLFLREPRCADLIFLLSFVIPLSSIHACCNGYHYGKQKTLIPSLSILIEQICRFAFFFFYLKIAAQNHSSISLKSTVYAILAGEFFSVLFSLNFLPVFFRQRAFKWLCHIKQVMKTSLPFTGNRLFTSLFASLEAVVLPFALKSFGFSTEKTFIYYGVLTGMVMPIVMFPTVFSNAASVLLLPNISGHKKANQENLIRHTIQKTVQSVYAIGLFFMMAFFLFSSEFSTLLFDQPLVAPILTSLAPSCIFYYLIPTLNSLLNGLGKTTLVFFNNILFQVLKIIFISVFVSKHGFHIYPYILIFLLFLQCCTQTVYLRSYLFHPVFILKTLVLPILFFILSFGCYLLVNTYLHFVLSFIILAFVYFLLLVIFQLFPNKVRRYSSTIH